MDQWYVFYNGEQTGPWTAGQVQQSLTEGRLTGAHVRHVSVTEWTPIQNHSSFRAPRQPPNLLGALILVLIGLSVVYFFVVIIPESGTNSVKSERDPTPTPSPAPTPTQRQRTVAEIMDDLTTVQTAVIVASAGFGPTKNKHSTGALALALWSNKRLEWSKLNTLLAVGYKEAKKDPVGSQSKRLCVKGSVVEISVQRADGAVYAEGSLDTSTLELIRFIAVHSTAKIVNGSRARFCGVVAGEMVFDNALGGAISSLSVVGMFDLPENRSWKPSVPSVPN